MYLPDAARFSKLLDLPEGADIGGAINDANYEDIHLSVGKFDFVMANPPFNVDKVNQKELEHGA